MIITRIPYVRALIPHAKVGVIEPQTECIVHVIWHPIRVLRNPLWAWIACDLATLLGPLPPAERPQKNLLAAS